MKLIVQDLMIDRLIAKSVKRRQGKCGIKTVGPGCGPCTSCTKKTTPPTSCSKTSNLLCPPCTTGYTAAHLAILRTAMRRILADQDKHR
jgi:hypothetical protein